MENLKKFLTSKETKRFYWTVLNVGMGLVVAHITFLASNQITWAITVLPIAIALSQALTKYYNKPFVVKNIRQ